MDELTKKGEKRCAKPGCKNEVTDDHECFGCGFFICEPCDLNHPMGPHDVIDHWSLFGGDEEPDDDEEEVT